MGEVINLDPKKNTTTQPMAGMTPSDTGMSTKVAADDQTAAMGGVSTDPVMPLTPTLPVDDTTATIGVGTTTPVGSVEPTELPVEPSVAEPMVSEPVMPVQAPMAVPGIPTVTVKGKGTV